MEKPWSHGRGYRDTLGFEVLSDVGLAGAFERLRAAGAEFVQEPVEQPRAT
ncbi:hypothetical protein [Streptomyces sp. NPDC091371]|uniref:hypothetical protein n=1 Tax=Streptomyces sp. NPDC091371 TaxID=3155303 RepID=UPI003429C22D